MNAWPMQKRFVNELSIKPFPTLSTINPSFIDLSYILWLCLKLAFLCLQRSWSCVAANWSHYWTVSDSYHSVRGNRSQRVGVLSPKMGPRHEIIFQNLVIQFHYLPNVVPNICSYPFKIQTVTFCKRYHCYELCWHRT